MEVTTVSTLEPTTAADLQAYYDRALLERALPLLLHDKFGQMRGIPLHAGRGGHGLSITFRKFGALPLNTTPLVEGVAPVGKKLSITDLKATVSQFGDYVTLTDKVLMSELDPLLSETAELLGEQSGQSLDAVYRDVLNAGTNVIYNGTSATARGNVDRFVDDTHNPFPLAIRTLENANVQRIKEMVKAGVKISTSPIRASFPALCGAFPKQDIEKLTNFVSYEEYAAYGDLMEGEFGAYKDIRFLMTTQAKRWANTGDTTGGDHDTAYSTSDAAAAGSGVAVDVFSVLIFGKNAYGICPLGPRTVENIITPPGGISDPLKQITTSGWKAITTAIILQEDFMVRCEVASVATP